MLRLVRFDIGQVLVDLILVAENVIVHVELLGRLGREHKRLHEATHGLAVVAQLSGDLNHDATSDGGLTVHLANLGVAVLEGQLLDLLVDLELTHDGLLGVLAWAIDATMNKCAAAAVEAVQNLRRFVQDGVVLAHEFATNLLWAWSCCHDHVVREKARVTCWYL